MPDHPGVVLPHLPPRLVPLRFADPSYEVVEQQRRKETRVLQQRPT